MAIETTAPPAPTPVSGRARPPGPVRRVQVSWLLGAVALALAVTLLVLWGFGRASDRREVVMVVAPVTAGQPIPASALGSTFVAVDSSVTQLFGIAQRDALAGKVATVNLSAGDLLGPSMVTAAPELPAGWVQVGAVLKPGRYPSTVKVGDRMLAVPVEGPGSPVEVLVVKATVGDDRALSTVLAVAAESGTVVAQWSATDTLILVKAAG